MATPLLLPPLLAIAAATLLAALPSTAAAADLALKPCRLPGVPNDALCGTLQRPLDPAQPGGTRIAVHVAVLPAVARNKKPDPLFFFAGGPGQSAIGLAGTLSRQFNRLGNRRDLVLIDQRGTGLSAPLQCAEESPALPLAEAVDIARQRARIEACRVALQKLPHGDLRQYTTTIAMQDVDAVRQALGVVQINAVGGSYGTRAVLEYQRQFPQTVRRAVIDGVAPPDMVLPASFSLDNQAAFDALLAACEADQGPSPSPLLSSSPSAATPAPASAPASASAPTSVSAPADASAATIAANATAPATACAQRYPDLRADWQRLLASLPREVQVRHPLTDRTERLTLTADTVIGLVRGPLYVPLLSSALPLAITQAAAGRFDALLGVSMAMRGGDTRRSPMAMGMHFSVVCAEDYPRLDRPGVDAPGADFGTDFADFYRQVCSHWPQGSVPAAFYSVPPAPAATLVLSGGIDPATPPRHGERVAGQLGAKARHVVVPQAGHGVMGLGCMRDVLFRFIDATDDAAALAVDAGCARAMPRPPALVPVTPALQAQGLTGSRP